MQQQFVTVLMHGLLFDRYAPASAGRSGTTLHVAQMLCHTFLAQTLHTVACGRKDQQPKNTGPELDQAASNESDEQTKMF